MIKHRQKLEHSREEMKESVGSEKVAGEENRDSLIEPGIQGWEVDCLLLPVAQE